MSGERLDAVMAMPEAAGRRQLAEHLATATDMPLEGIRAALAAGHRDPVAHAQELVDRLREGRRAGPMPKPAQAFKPKIAATNEAEEMGDRVVAMHRRHGPARSRS